MARTVTPKQAVFAREFALSGNATQAALAAGYAPKNAGVQGYQLLQKSLVKAEIRVHQDEAVQIYEVSREKILQGHAKIAAMQPQGSPSYTDVRGSLDSMAKIGGLIVDKTEIVGATWQDFRDSLAEQEKKPSYVPYDPASHRPQKGSIHWAEWAALHPELADEDEPIDVTPPEVTQDPVTAKPNEPADLAPEDTAPVFDNSAPEEKPEINEVKHEYGLGFRPRGFGDT